jgi:hypothetical protein
VALLAFHIHGLVLCQPHHVLLVAYSTQLHAHMVASCLRFMSRADVCVLWC